MKNRKIFLWLTFFAISCFSSSLASGKSAKQHEPMPCCEEEIEKVRVAAESETLANAKFKVFVDRTNEARHNTYAEDCWEDEDITIGCDLHISEKLFKTYTRGELYSALAHEVCHHLETMGARENKESDTSEEGDSEFFADKCSLGIIMRLGFDPRVVISGLIKGKKIFSPFASRKKRLFIEMRISRIEKEIEKMERLKK